MISYFGLHAYVTPVGPCAVGAALTRNGNISEQLYKLPKTCFNHCNQVLGSRMLSRREDSKSGNAR